MQSHQILSAAAPVDSALTQEQQLMLHSEAQLNSFFINLHSPQARGVLVDTLHKYFSLRDKVNLAMSCRYLHTFFKRDIKEQLTLLADRLLTHVVRGEQDEAERMLKAMPGLVLVRGTVKAENDYSGRSMENATAFQGALRMKDHNMWRMVEPFFDKFPNGHAHKAMQFYEEFPYSKEFPKQMRNYWVRPSGCDFLGLIRILNQSSNAQVQAALNLEENDNPVCEKIKELRKYVTDSSLTNRHFNPCFLIEAIYYYDEYIVYTNNQFHIDFYQRQVIGFMDRFVSTELAQTICNGLHGIVREGNPLKRILNFPTTDAPFFQPALGYSFCSSLHISWGYQHTTSLLEDLYEAKLKELKKLKRRIDHPELSCEETEAQSRPKCVIS